MECVKAGTTITVIAGDIFHNKGRIESAGFQLFSRFLQKLSKLTPVYFICGNHDFRQEDPRIPDMLESMLDPWLDAGAGSRIHYWKDTGHYEVGNVGFGVVSVKDTLRAGNTSGLVKKLPEYPSVGMFSEGVSHRIALFHGTVKACKLQNGMESNGVVYPLEWFKGYDYLVLGDVHKQQTGVTGFGLKWGYPGSLVQQDHGETIFGHGFLVWDLEAGEVTSHHVPNTYGMFTMRVRNDCAEVYTGLREWKLLKSAVEMAGFPRRPVVRVHGATTHETEEILKEYGIFPRNVIVLSRSVELDEDKEEAGDQDMEQLTQLCNPEKWKEYIHGVAPHLELDEWLDAPETMNIPRPDESLEIPSAIVSKIQDRFNKVLKLLHEYRESLGSVSTTQRNVVVLKKATWDYTLCYGQDNHFDFESIKDRIALLNGRNATGKSSFLEMLCLGLFGEQTRSKVLSGKKMTAKVIHNKKPMNKRAMNIRIIFTVNDRLYEIIREFGVQADKSNVSQFGVELYEVVGEDKQLVREGVSAVNTWMEKHVGTMETVLLSNFITQVDNNNFFTLRQEDQKELMERALHLEAVTALASLIHEARLGHTHVIGQVSAVVETTQKMRATEAVDRPEALEARIQKLEKRLVGLNERKTELLGVIGGVEYNGDGVEACDTRIAEQVAILDSIGELTVEDHAIAHEAKGAKMEAIQAIRQEYEGLGEDACDMDYETLEAMYENAKHEVESHAALEPEAPKYTREAIRETARDYKVWRESQPDEYLERDTDELIAELHSIEEEWNSLDKEFRYRYENDMGVSKPHFEKPDMVEEVPDFQVFSDRKKEVSVMHKKWLKLTANPVQCDRSEVEYKAWTKRYTKWLEKYDSVTDVDLDGLMKKSEDLAQDAMIREVLADLDAEIASYKDLPFNADCWACQQQPWRKHFDEKMQKTKQLRKKLQGIHKRIGGEADPNEKAGVDELIRLRKEYDDQMGHWTEEYERWEACRAQWKAAKKHAAEVQKLEAALASKSWGLWLFYRNYEQDMMARLKKYEAQHTRLNVFIKEYQMWDEMLKKMQDAQDKHGVYKTWAERKEELEQEVKKIGRWRHRMELEHKLAELTDTLQIDEKRVQRFRTWEAATKEKAYWEAQKAHAEYAVVRGDIESTEGVLKETRMMYGHAQAAYDKYVRIERLLGLQKRYLADLKAREGKLEEFERWFAGNNEEEGYKKWIYVTKVIPLLQKELNRCLRGVESLRMKIDYDKGGFVYMVEDGDRKPSLDKASGYQNFIISLCMRITLGRIGATHHNLRQLIIDEGFTSCDADNLGKMPEFLSSLLRNGDYDSVLLMSHLEGIRESTSVKIDIQQEGPFSIIRWGDAYPSLKLQKPMVDTVEPPKKRGRPKKSV
jgi:DNA repair exonuclease SbcCD ATPase subunit/DNA repair exonuclease SbcCD nuclease subunit